MSNETLSYPDAAEEVLRRYSKGAPMHYRRITDLAVQDGLIVPGGNTPEASLNASINLEIKRKDASGRPQRFRAMGRGMYGLQAAAGELAPVIEKKNATVKRRLREVLAEMDPFVFEELIGQLLVALGFEDVEVTKRSGDGGIDVRARLAVGGVTNVRTAIQVKRWSSNVSGRTVRELRGALGPHERGLIITLSKFTREARNDASAEDRTPVSLIEGSKLIDLLMDNGIGVTSRSYTVYELDEGQFVPPDEDESDDPGSPVSTVGRRDALATDKVLSVWPLPGGRSSWKDSLDRMLAFVAETGPTVSTAIDWLIETFDRVTSTKVARGYWQLTRSFGLTETDGEQLLLSVDGRQYLDDNTAQTLLRQMEKRVVGFTEVRSYLGERPHTPVEILERIRADLGVGWEKTVQVDFRLGWLENVGVASVNKGLWAAANYSTDEGPPPA